MARISASPLCGVLCTDCLTPYPDGVVDPPCQVCSSSRRTFTRTLTAAITAKGTIGWLRRDIAKRVLGYGDTGRHGTVRHGNVEDDNSISLTIEGRPPQNEDDSGTICETVAAAMSREAEIFTGVASGDRDVDGTLTSASRRLQVQIVRALSRMTFWRALAIKLRVSQRLTLSEASDFLKESVYAKAAKLATEQRAELVLALDANRLPALALQPVAERFGSEHGNWCAGLGFQQVWLVGPTRELTWRLDGPMA